VIALLAAWLGDPTYYINCLSYPFSVVYLEQPRCSAEQRTQPVTASGNQLSREVVDYVDSPVHAAREWSIDIRVKTFQWALTRWTGEHGLVWHAVITVGAPSVLMINLPMLHRYHDRAYSMTCSVTDIFPGCCQEQSPTWASFLDGCLFKVLRTSQFGRRRPNAVIHLSHGW